MNRREPEVSPKAETPVRIVTITDDNATIALIEFTGMHGDTLHFTGSSKREPGDPRDESIGRTLAVARALKNAGEAFELYVKEYVSEIYGD